MAYGEDGLTEKQRIFCNEYMIDFNARRAALAAGYSENSADSIANENLNKPEVQSYLKVMQDRIAAKHEISRDRVLRELSAIAFSDTRQFFNEEGNVKGIQELSDAAAAAIMSIDSEEERIEGVLIATTKKVRRWDKLRALEQIIKMCGYDVDPSQGKAKTITIKLSE